jgi:hypothetical protein
MGYDASMLKRWVLIAFLFAGCESSKDPEPAVASPAVTPAPAAAGDVRGKWAAAHAAVESLQKELELTEVAITIYTNNVLGNKGQVTTEATIKEAHERLPILEREKSELVAKLAKARAEEAKHAAGAEAARTQGIQISDECKANPLAKGCS